MIFGDARNMHILIEIEDCYHRNDAFFEFTIGKMKPVNYFIYYYSEGLIN